MTYFPWNSFYVKQKATKDTKEMQLSLNFLKNLTWNITYVIKTTIATLLDKVR